MPPIYNFELEGFPKESRWGWYRAVDVLEVLKNILYLNGDLHGFEPWMAEREFPSIKLGTVPAGNVWDECSPVVEEGKPFGRTMVGSNWFEVAVEGDYYIPAKVGIQLIDAVKHPFKHNLKKVVGLIS